MPYKVFYVEDELITREGIRDNVDWNACGFEFCGEAADGEMALPLLGMAKPDVLITDIKMPFMDGLQLSKIVRARMPWVKIVILSGHDEFEYARQAINLGVTEYLLKPVTVQKLEATLHKLAAQLEEERKELEKIERLQQQVQESQATLRERLLFKMVIGAISPVEAIEQGHILGLDLSARYYGVVVLKIELGDRTEQFDYDEFHALQAMVADLSGENPDIFVLRRDWGDMILVFKGGRPEFLTEERDLFLERIKQAMTATRYQPLIAIGTIKDRIADISKSYIEALEHIQNPGSEEAAASLSIERAELLKLDKQVLENYLYSGTKDQFDGFFQGYVHALGENALRSNLIKNYILMDVLLAVAKMANDLGGEMENILPDLGSIELVMSNIKTLDELHAQAKKIMTAALEYRDSQAHGQYKKIIREAREYIHQHYTNHELSLNAVALHVNLSASHFSVVFSQETGQTFKEYLTEVRINKAKELLRMTALRSADIAYQVGYNDPHYFSSVFKKNTGLSPLEFRSAV